MSYTLLGMPGSPFVRKARVCLLEKGLAFTDEFVNIFPVPAGFEKVNPMRRVPVLRFEHDGSTVHLADTTAIAAFLDRAHPAPRLLPDDPVALGRALMWEELADTTLAAVVGLGIFRPLVTHQFTGKPVDHARVRRALEQKLPPLFDALTGELGERPHFTEGFGIVDIAVATQFVNLHHAGQRMDPARWPVLASWLDRVLARDSFAACLEWERHLPAPVPLE
jgi:glutathione S-transferase